MKVEQRELHYPHECQDAADFSEAGHDRFWVFLVGINQVGGKDVGRSNYGDARRAVIIFYLYIIDKR
jgi:hypothetical protein